MKILFEIDQIGHVVAISITPLKCSTITVPCPFCGTVLNRMFVKIDIEETI